MQHVLIIGGGMAGASAAFFLAPGRQVTVLEAEAHCRRPASCTTTNLNDC
ncbi:FAD-dependent oxidoreductase [Mesorhizobium loti]|nr:FAD-dependent oxidoreductase [Mesorhizobium loti]